MEPKPRTIGAFVFGALLIVIALWLIVRILESIWLPLLIIALVVIGIIVAGWFVHGRFRRW